MTGSGSGIGTRTTEMETNQSKALNCLSPVSTYL